MSARTTKVAALRTPAEPEARAGSRASQSKNAKLTREERAVRIREAIYRAAADVVGEYGYADASISRITDRAGIAQGTFYLYFETRQALFDELLPHVGQDMMNFIRERVHGLKSYLAVEEEGFRAFFDFCAQNMGFVRLLNEAETAAPIAHRAHFKMLVDHYAASIRRSIAIGELKKFSAKEVEALVYALMGVRSYLFLGFIKYAEGGARLPESVVQTYMKLVRHGIQ